MNELRTAAGEWVRGRRNAAVSLKGLLAATATGFTIGSALFRKRAPPARHTTAPAVRGSLFTVLAGLIASGIRAHYGDPWTMASRLFAHHRATGPARTPRYPTR